MERFKNFEISQVSNRMDIGFCYLCLEETANSSVNSATKMMME